MGSKGPGSVKHSHVCSRICHYIIHYISFLNKSNVPPYLSPGRALTMSVNGDPKIKIPNVGGVLGMLWACAHGTSNINQMPVAT